MIKPSFKCLQNLDSKCKKLKFLHNFLDIFQKDSFWLLFYLENLNLKWNRFGFRGVFQSQRIIESLDFIPKHPFESKETAFRSSESEVLIQNY